MAHVFRPGDRVEVLRSSDFGARGRVVSSDKKHCRVKITQSGSGHNTVRLIGQTVEYKHTELNGI